MNSLKDYIEVFTHLHTAKVKGHKAPHKAILLLSIIDLIESEVIRYPQIELTDELIDKFNCIWKRYLDESSIFTPDITKPYFHMQHEPFWKLVEKYDIDAMLVAEDEPWSKENRKRKIFHQEVILLSLCVMLLSLPRLMIHSSNYSRMQMPGLC